MRTKRSFVAWQALLALLGIANVVVAVNDPGRWWGWVAVGFVSAAFLLNVWVRRQITRPGA